MENFYAFHLPHGDLLLYGDNLPKCKPYIGDIVDSAEDICDYCSQHNLRVYHLPKHFISGLFEIFLVYKLTTKYSVRSSWKEVQQYFESKR